jgi:hypothetical protein
MAQPKQPILQNLLNDLGKFMLSIEVGHTTGSPVPVLKVWFPAEWLILADNNFIVEAEYLSDEMTVYFIGADPEARVYGNTVRPYGADELMDYAKEIIRHNDEIELRKIELDRLMRQRMEELDKTLSEHKAKLQASGVEVRQIVVKKPAPEYKLHEIPKQDDLLPPIQRQPLRFEDYVPPRQTLDAPLPVVRRTPQLPQGFDPSILDPDADRDDDLVPYVPPARPTAPRPPVFVEEEEDGPRLVAPPVAYDRDTPIRQLHRDE